MKFFHYKTFNKHTNALILVVFLIFVVVSVLFAINSVGAGEEHAFSGWAWSDNVGWISFNCTNTESCAAANYGVSLSPETGVLFGYAWSSNIGWISFNEEELAGCPEGPCRAKWENNQLSGWARALSHGGGWDGWVSVSGANPTYGISTDVEGTGLVGYAWGADVIGWVLFNLPFDFGGVTVSDTPDEPEEEPTLTECEDGADNDNDGLIDRDDPGCWTNQNIPSTYNPLDNDEFHILQPTLTAFPGTIVEGETTTVSWECFDSNTSSGVNFSTGGAVTGDVEDAPSDDTAYSVVCSNGGEAHVDVVVLHPEVSIVADPSLVQYNGASTISWSAFNVTSCIVEGPLGFSGEGLSGSQSIGPLTAQSEYSIVCQSPSGPKDASVIVNVLPEFGEI